ncbi:MAG: 3-dehydroquinate synthase [Acidobacteria bacterium]|nr:3-dehydroquinate synthase [Acidobacteriota bacterium]
MRIRGVTGECEIILGGKLGDVSEHCCSDRVVVVTDPTVRRLHGAGFPSAPVVEIGEGEESKTLETVSRIYERFLELELDRTSFVLGIGGGVVCDVTGFAASTFCRGLPFGFVPTTMLAQVDASLGGKNGVNLRAYKNLVGTIRQPRFCLLDYDLLRTLPTRAVRCGIAEIVKSAAVGDEELFGMLEVDPDALLALERGAVHTAVSRSVAVKAAVVEEDESDQAARMKLNFGHTLGHSIEKAVGLPHGEAVSVGMVAAARVSVGRGRLPDSAAKRLATLLTRFGLPTRIEWDEVPIIDAIGKDKKRAGGRLRMTLLDRIGHAVVEEVTVEELMDAAAVTPQRSPGR